VTTPYHARYIAHELTRRRPAASSDRLSTSLFDATVDLNPHQIDAAMFALESPLRKGVIFADEVGLGKTIEAGLVLCQYWAERRRRLLVVCPASLRKQWSMELQEKFNLPTVILDAPAFRQAQRDGIAEPFATGAVVITSINYASAMQGEVRAVPWDIVVVDEAHKLRNSYRPSNKMGQRIRWALEGRRKILLTATPLQNSLLELYGLSTVIDDHLFGDASAFRAMYMRQDSDLGELRGRLDDFVKRTLRNQVLEYIRYTERRAITQPFRPTDDEHGLYEAVSEFLLREGTYAIPSRQRQLTVLILRKLLASSSQAIAGTLETIRARLIRLRDRAPAEEVSELDFLAQLIGDEEMEEEIIDEADDGEGEEAAAEALINRMKLDAEIAELGEFIARARGIGVDTKSRALVGALKIGFKEIKRMGAARKAIIFTESRRTQEYLYRFLEANGYAGRLVLFNGTNTDPESRRIYDRWVSANAEAGRTGHSRVVDIRTALIEHFRDDADVMIATEAAGEGINLQFCSLVINYDLPWNPQRIEQRIGRCHRYGQEHDVVVLNFLNERNDADRRVLELLSQKFNLFSGLFGVSDEVLGAIESGVDFEKRILDIYQLCRTPKEIQMAFEGLREEMDEIIQARMDETRRKLLERFDEDVHARFKMQLDNTASSLT
jgi:superfamily II DNA/RNA helicase